MTENSPGRSKFSLNSNLTHRTLEMWAYPKKICLVIVGHEHNKIKHESDLSTAKQRNIC